MLSTLINPDLSRGALVVQVGVAALAAVGINSLSGPNAQPLAIPVLTVVLTLVLVAGPTLLGSTATFGNDDPAIVDPLTGVATQRVGAEVLVREFSAAQRGRPLTIVLVRLEGLPKYRAQHGQIAADQLLRLTGRALQRHRRRMHVAALHPGRDGTFLSILSGSDRDGATVYAARLRRDLLRLGGLPEPDGVSVGIASFDLSMGSPKELVRQAAIALEKGAAVGGKVIVVGSSDAA